MSSWKETASKLSLREHRLLSEVRTPPKRGGSVQFEGGGPGEFKDDMERWEWERVQWKNHKDKDRAWLDSNGDRIFGPPIYPGAAVVERNSFLLAVEQAREMGFVLGRELWTVAFERPWPLPMHLECVRKVATQNPEIVRCVLRLPLLEVEGVTQHVRCFDLDELKLAYLSSPEAPILRRRYREAFRKGRAKAAVERKRKRERDKYRAAKRARRAAEREAEEAARAERRRLRQERRALKEKSA